MTESYQTLFGLTETVSDTIITNTLVVDTLNGVLKATSGLVSGSATTSDLPEGSNAYFTVARARNAFTGSFPIIYDSASGIIGVSYTGSTGININGNVISGGYSGSTGINIDGNVISGGYSGGTGININGNVISGGYSGGTGININGNVISSLTSYSGSTGVSINGNLIGIGQNVRTYDTVQFRAVGINQANPGTSSLWVAATGTNNGAYIQTDQAVAIIGYNNNNSVTSQFCTNDGYSARLSNKLVVGNGASGTTDIAVRQVGLNSTLSLGSAESKQVELKWDNTNNRGQITTQSTGTYPMYYDASLHNFSRGNVGINETSPAYKTVIRDQTTSPQLSLVYSGTSASNNKELLLGYNGVAGSGYGWIQPIHNGTAYTPLSLCTFGGNVGVGITGPSSLLDVAGFIRSTNTSGQPTTGTGVETLYNTTLNAGYVQTYDRTSSAYKPLRLEGNVVSLNPTSGGNVGIGFTGPTVKLDIADATASFNNVQRFRGNYAIDGYGAYISFTDFTPTDLGRIGAIRESNNNVGLSFSTFSGSIGERMRISASGSVGIGTVSPETLLHVAKASSAGVGGRMILDNTAAATTGNACEIAFLTDSGASASSYNANVKAIQDGSGFGYTALTFGTFGGAGVPDERMRITPVGNVGIATTIPNRRLTIQGTGATRDSLLYLKQTNDFGYSFNLDSSSSGKLSIVGVNNGVETIPILCLDRTNTFVGVGTSTTASALNVVTNSSSEGTNYGKTIQTVRETASAVHLAMVRQSNYVWGIGYLYNTNTFAIFNGVSATDSSNTSAAFSIDTSNNASFAGNVAISGTGTTIGGYVQIPRSCCGEVYQSGSTTQALTLSGAKLTIFDSVGISNFTTPSSANDQITILVAGTYQCTFRSGAQFASLSGGIGILSLALQRNSSSIAAGIQYISSDNTADTSMVVCQALVDCAVNDVITIFGGSNPAQTITFASSYLSVTRVGSF